VLWIKQTSLVCSPTKGALQKIGKRKEICLLLNLGKEIEDWFAGLSLNLCVENVRAMTTEQSWLLEGAERAYVK